MLTTYFLASVAIGIALGALVFAGPGTFLLVIGISSLAAGVLALAAQLHQVSGAKPADPGKS